MRHNSACFSTYFFLYTVSTGICVAFRPFLGNIVGVCRTFFTIMILCLRSVKGMSAEKTSVTSPPRIDIAGLASLSSSSARGPFSARKYPPTFTSGKHHSESVRIFATALETTVSYFSRCRELNPHSSARACKKLIPSVMPISAAASFRNSILLFKESSNGRLIAGNAHFNTSPGKPAPAPTSITLPDTSFVKMGVKLSRKCFLTTSSCYVILVRLTDLLRSTSML